MDAAERPMEDEEQRRAREAEKDRRRIARTALWAVGGAMMGGLVTIVLFALSARELPRFLTTAGVGVLLGATAAMAGGLLGFLFGIPRSLQGTETGGGQTQTTDGARTVVPATFAHNTNLEQISDWLTKILVGVGLTQLNEVPDRLGALASFVAPAFGDVPRPDVFGIATLLYFAIAGFLFAYLWTRFFMGRALRHADLEAQFDALWATFRSNRQRERDRDDNAQELVRRHLSPTESDVSPDELTAAIKGATVGARMRIRDRALAASRFEKTIPIFRALLETDNLVDDHHQLAWALAANGDWAEAEQEIRKAIKRRESRWGWHEFLLAKARIAQAGDAVPSPNLAEIKADLAAAFRDKAAVAELTAALSDSRGEKVADWIRRNGLTENDLGLPEGALPK